MPGAMPGHQEIGRAHVAVEQVVEGRLVEIRGGAEPRSPGVVDQDIHFADLVDQASHRRHVFEIGGHKTGAAPLRLDLSDHLGTTFGVAAVDDDLPAVVGQAAGRSLGRYQRSRQSRARCPVPCL